jgi:phosphatidylinositol dimannoside acyltransferase
MVHMLRRFLRLLFGMSWGRVWQRAQNESRDAWTLLVLPAISAVLPWFICYKFYDLLVRRTCIFKADALRAHAASLRYLPAPTVATGSGPTQAATRWVQRRQLTCLLDHADFFLSHSHLDRWFKRRIQVRGGWPSTQQAALVLTFHWGAGMLALHHMRQSGRLANMLVNAAHPAHFKGRSIQYAYIRARIRRISQLLGRPTIDAQTNMRPALKALQRGEHVVAVIDVPADRPGLGQGDALVGGLGGGPGDGSAERQAAQAVQLLGQRALVPRPLMRYAVDKQIPVTVYLTGIDFANGHRSLHIHSLGCFDHVDTLAQQVFDLLNVAIETNPPAWHLWSETPRFFQTGLSE